MLFINNLKLNNESSLSNYVGMVLLMVAASARIRMSTFKYCSRQIDAQNPREVKPRPPPVKPAMGFRKNIYGSGDLESRRR